MGLLERIQKITNKEEAPFDPLADQLVARIGRLEDKKEDLYTILSLLKAYTPFHFAVVGLWDAGKEEFNILTSAGIGELSISFKKKLSQYREQCISAKSFIILGTGKEWELDEDLANATLWGYHLGTWEQKTIFFFIGSEQKNTLSLESLENILPRIAEKFISFVRKNFSENLELKFNEIEKDDSLSLLIDQLFSREISESNGFYLFKIKELTEDQARHTRKITSPLGSMVSLKKDTWALICDGNLDEGLIHHHLERILDRSLEDPVRITSRQEALRALS